MKLKITVKDLLKGDQNSAESCPLANVVNEQLVHLPVKDMRIQHEPIRAWVGVEYLFLEYKCPISGVMRASQGYEHTVELAEFINDFDEDSLYLNVELDNGEEWEFTSYDYEEMVEKLGEDYVMLEVDIPLEGMIKGKWNNQLTQQEAEFRGVELDYRG